MGQDPFGLIATTVEGRFRVDQLVGEGGFGVVYRGYHLSFRQKVAVKVLKVPVHFTTEARSLFLEKFREEGEHLAKLSEHRSVVRVFDFGTTPTASGAAAPYLVLDWLEGRSLDKHLALRAAARQGVPSEAEVVEFMRPVIDAIAFAHRLNIAHRDLKPANVFVAETALGQVPKVLDFGIAKAMQEGESATVLATNTSSGFGAFSPPYGAPEQFLRKRYGPTGPWTDVYALGLLLVELLTGRRAYDGDEQPEFFLAATSDARPTPRARGREVSEELEAVCAKALALMPQDRYPNAGELLAALPRVSLPAGTVPLALDAAQRELLGVTPEFAESAETGEFLEALAGRDGTMAEPPPPAGTATGASTHEPGETAAPAPTAEPRDRTGARGGTVPAGEPPARIADSQVTPPATVQAEPAPLGPPRPTPRGRGKLVAAGGAGLVVALVASWLSLGSPPDADEPAGEPPPSAAASTAALHASAVPSLPSTATVSVPRAGRCPQDMVRVADRFCVDRYEAVLLDRDSGQRLSPYYGPGRSTALGAEKAARAFSPDAGADAEVPLAATMPLPPLPDWQRKSDAVLKAASLASEVPNAMVASKQAETACNHAGKRLCTLDEWRTACAGQAETKFPYGNAFQHGACNIFTEAHPTALLFGNASVGHTDPRVNLVESNGRTLLQKTGETRSCKSSWGSDAIYDMVGNLMEWVSTPDGFAAVGGYYAQSSKNGCEMNAGTGLGMGFANYTTGFRCCADPTP